MTSLAAAIGIPSTSTLLTIGALLATFVAGLFARSVLEHEIGLYRHAQLKRGYREHAAAHPYQRPQPLELTANYSELVPITRQHLEQAERDAELQTMVAWPTRLG